MVLNRRGRGVQALEETDRVSPSASRHVSGACCAIALTGFMRPLLCFDGYMSDIKNRDRPKLIYLLFDKSFLSALIFSECFLSTGES
jgi:hypothetical protein